MFNYEDIRNELKKNKYVIYKVKNNKFTFELKFNGTKSELIKELDKKIKSFDYFICFKFGFHTGTKPLQGGPLSVTISTFDFIENKFKNGKQINGKIWFQKKYLEKFGWKDNYLNEILNKLLSGKVKLNPLVVNMFNVYFL
jgi:hypothetical protein